MIDTPGVDIGIAATIPAVSLASLVPVHGLPSFSHCQSGCGPRRGVYIPGLGLASTPLRKRIDFFSIGHHPEQMRTFP